MSGTVITISWVPEGFPGFFDSAAFSPFRTPEIKVKHKDYDLKMRSI